LALARRPATQPARSGQACCVSVPGFGRRGGRCVALMRASDRGASGAVLRAAKVGSRNCQLVAGHRGHSPWPRGKLCRGRSSGRRSKTLWRLPAPGLTNTEKDTGENARHGSCIARRTAIIRYGTPSGRGRKSSTIECYGDRLSGRRATRCLFGTRDAQTCSFRPASVLPNSPSSVGGWRRLWRQA